MTRTFRITTYLLFSLFTSITYGQTGPGGVGSNDGTSTLELWLKSDAGVLNTSAAPAADGESVDDWEDQSGNGNDFTQDYGGNPVYRDNSGVFSLDFSSGSVYLRSASFFSGTGARTMIMVAKPTSLSTGSNNCIFQLGPNESGGKGYALFTEAVSGSSGLALRVSGNKIINYTTSTSDPTLFSVQNGASENVTDAEFYANGNAETTLVSQSANALNTSSLGAIVGGFSSGGDNDPENTFDFNGDIYEILVFSEELNDVDRILIENYLGPKYGITPANDYFSYESTHQYDIAGIGRESGASHTDAQSANILRVNGASSLDANGDFLLFGHDNGSIASWTTTEAMAASNIQRIAREWRVTHSGDVGTVTLAIDTADLPVKPANYDFYQIWVDTDGDFSSGATVYPVTLNGSNEYEASGITLSTGDHIAIAVFQPEITFDASISNGSETTGGPTFGLTLNYAAPRDVTVDYSDAGTGSADEGGGNDFTIPSGTATFSAGSTTTNATLSINNDSDLESDETIVFDLSNPSNGILGSITTHTYTINDDDNPRKIDFQTASANGGEGTTPITITIEINSADPSNPTTVDYTVSGGTATGSGTDYTLADGTATIAATTTSTTLNVSIVDDLIDEVDETIVVSLSNPSNANLGTDLVHTYTINDDDSEPTVEWITASAFGYEDAGSGSLVLTLSAVSGQDITIDYAITGGTATGSGTDYTLADGTATISAGNLTGAIPFSINDDASVESPETIEVTISNPSGATLGATTVHTFTINDNDNDGFTGPGGVGGTDGGSSLELWLKADAGVEESASDAAEVGDAVENWLDQSGNGNDVTQDYGINPNYVQNGDIFGIDFSTGSAYLRGSSFLSGTGARTIVSVVQPGSLTASTTNCYFQLAPNESAGKGYALFTEGVGASSGLALRVSGNKVMNYSTSTTSPTIISVQNGIGENVTDAEFFANGDAQTTLVTQSAAALNTSSLGMIVGGFSVGADNDPESTYDFDGSVHEVLVFSKELNDAERIILENYLGLKYDISISNDLYAFQTEFDTDLAGIGQEGTDTHVAAMSGNMLGVSNASSLDTDGDYLLFAHDNESIASWVTTDAPNDGVNTYRVDRAWKFDENGNVGSVTMLVDTSDLPAKPGGFTQYAIWVDSDGTFSSDATQYQLTLAGSYYQASGVDIGNGEYVTIGMVKPTVEFTNATSNGSETSAASIEITLNYALGSDMTVDYTITGGSATGSGTDYTLADGTATIIAGQTTTTINPSIINDTDVESDETIEVTLSNPSSGISIGTNSAHTYSINDDDNSRKIDFDAASGSGGEGTTPVTLTIEINSVDGSNPTTVDYAVTGGTATGGGTDYTLASGTATIVATTTSTTFDIAISDDLMDEDDETIIITLSNPSNANLGTDQTYTHTITDDDAEPQVQFLTTSSFGYEDAGSGALILSLTAPSGQDITVDYTVSGGTATGSGTDYTLAAGTATIDAGSSNGSIAINITDDGDVEAQETVQVTISNPSGATLGANTVHTFTINDNDNSGFTGPGGVGSIDGSSSLELWLRSDAGVEEAASDEAEVGDNVENWLDQSGNGNDFNHDYGINPVYTQSGSIYSLDFSAGSAYLRSSSFLSGTGARTVITVGQPNSLTAATSNCIFQLGPNEAAGQGYALFTEGVGASNGLALRVSGNKVMNYTTSTTSPTILSVQNGFGENVTDADFYANGTAQTTLVTQSANVLNTSSLGVTIGGFSSGADNDPESAYDFDGDIHEIIVFSKELNDAERVLIENSLGAKYGLTVGNDVYSYDAGHGKDVAGIGQEGTDTHTAALSASMFGVSNPSSVDTDGDYLVFGHDDGSVASWTTTDAPNNGDNTYRLAREWRFDHSGDVGTVTLLIDTANLPAKPTGYTEYVAWTDANGVFATDATQIELTLAGSYYQASGITIADASFLTIGMVRPTISFDAASSNGSETSAASIPVSLNFALGADATVDYTVTGGTASGSDYTLAAGTLTILAGQTTANITPSIINDTNIESDETIEITLSNPSSGVILGDETEHTYSINDDDNSRKIDFQATTDNGDEGTTPVTITVQINSVDATNPTTADYAVTAGTANGDDYTLASGTVTIAATTTTNTFDLVIDEDAIDEADETVIITLSNPTNANLGTNQTFTYTINDNDAAPTLTFNSAASAGSEGGSTANLRVDLSAESGQDVTVDYAVSGGTATGSGDDYTLAAGTLTISAGSTSGNIQVAVHDDSELEVGETVEVTISNPSGATISGISVHTYTINDNDNGGYQGPGGIGAIDGSSTLELWLKADAGVEEAGSDPAEVSDNVENWLDQSGNGNDFNHDFGTNPTYALNGGLYSIDFSGGSQYLRSGAIISGSGPRTVMVAAKPGSLTASGSNAVFQLAPNAGAGEGYALCYEGVGGSSGLAVRVSGNKIMNYAVSTANPSIISVQNGDGENITDCDFFADGTAQTTLVSQSANTLNTSSAGIVIGGFSTDADNDPEAGTYDFNGDIYEIIVFSEELPSAKRIIIENYLGAKYGLTVGDEKFTESQGGTDYKYDVAGIGHEGGTNFQNQAQSAGILTVSDASTLASGDYLMFGHDDASIASWTTTEAPGANQERLAREWYFEETNDVGSITITIDTTLLPARSADFENFVVFVDGDGDFTSGATSYPLELVSGAEFAAEDVAIADGDYVAIGAVQYITQATGDWDVAATWQGNTIPGSTDDAVITGAHVVTLTQNESVGSLDIGTNATLDIGTHTLTFTEGCMTLGANATVTMTTGKIIYNKGGDQCVTGNTTNFSSYANLSLEGSGTKTLGDDIVVTDNIDIASNVTLDVSGSDYGITIGGDWDNNGTFSPQGGTVTFNGSSDQDIDDASGTATFNSLAISNTGGAVEPSVHLELEDGLTILAGTGVLDMSVNGKDLTIKGDWVNNNGASGFVQGDEAVTFAGPADQSISNSTGTEIFNDLNISNTGGAVKPNAHLDIDDDLTIMAGTGALDMATNSKDINIAGNWVNNRGTSGFLHGTNAVTFDNSSISSIVSSGTATFYDLNISNTAGSVRAGSNIDVTNDLTILAGTGVLDMSSNSKDLTVGGNWTNNNGAGGFLHGSRTVTFDGGANQTINSSIATESFYNLTIANSAGSVRPAIELDIANDLTINGSGVLDISVNSQDMTIAGDWTNNNGASGFVPGTQTVTFDNASNATIENSSGTETFYHLNINNTAGSVRSNSNIDIDGNLTIMAGTGVLNTLVNSNDVLIAGNWANNNGVGGYLEGTNTVTFNGGADQNITNSTGTETFYDLTISNSAGAVKPSSILDINNDLTISGAGVLDVTTNDIQINLAGDWSNTNGAGGFLQGDETVVLDGTAAQTITNAAGESFYNLTINKSSGDANLGGDIGIDASGALTMTSGDLVLGANDLIIEGTGGISGGSATSYIQSDGGGVIRKKLTGNGTTIFPTGDSDEYSPFTFTLNGGTLTAAYIDLSVVDAGHPSRGAATDYISRYWQLDQNGITGAIDYDVSYTYLNADVVGDEGDMHQAKWSGSVWDSGGGINTGTNTVSRTGIGSFSAFTAMDNTASALPVDLIDFTAQWTSNDAVELNWITASEFNNDYFSIDRSSNGQDFDWVVTIAGNGTQATEQHYDAIDFTPYSGVSYYQLTQVDFNGTKTVYGPIAVNSSNADVPKSISVYPNPVLKGGQVRISGRQTMATEEIIIIVKDVTGRTHYSKAIVTNDIESFSTIIDIDEALPAGIYHVIGSSDRELFNRKIIVR